MPVDPLVSTIEALWLKWAWLVVGWDIGRVYYDRDWVLESGEPSAETAAEAVADWRYLEGTVRFALHRLQGRDEPYIEAVVVHEMMHFLLNELRAGVPAEQAERHQEHEERAATELTRLFLRTDQRYDQLLALDLGAKNC